MLRDFDRNIKLEVEIRIILDYNSEAQSGLNYGFTQALPQYVCRIRELRGKRCLLLDLWFLDSARAGLNVESSSILRAPNEIEMSPFTSMSIVVFNQNVVRASAQMV